MLSAPGRDAAFLSPCRCVTELPEALRSAVSVGREFGRDALRDKLIKIGAKVVRHARYVTFQLAEVAIPRRLYREILERIRRD